jgi:hypothetical protein
LWLENSEERICFQTFGFPGMSELLDAVGIEPLSPMITKQLLNSKKPSESATRTTKRRTAKRPDICPA